MTKKITRTVTGYGGFKGGDPRTFSPDMEMCSNEEFAEWERDCAAWNAGNEVVVKDGSFSVYDKDGRERLHVYAPRYGIGVYQYEEELEAIELIRETPIIMHVPIRVLVEEYGGSSKQWAAAKSQYQKENRKE
jgi:hypothetical protein